MTTNGGERKLYNEIMAEIEEITTPISPLDDALSFEWVKQSNYTFSVGLNGNFEVRFDAKYGSIASLYDVKAKDDGVNYGKNIGSFLYQTFTEKQFDEYIDEYSIKPDRVWVYYNYGKVGLDRAINGSLRYQNVHGYISNLYRDANDENVFCVEFVIGANASIYNELREYYGSPMVLYHVYNFSGLVSGERRDQNTFSLQSRRL